MLSGLPKTVSRQSRLRLLANMPYMLSNEMAKKTIASFLSVKTNLGSERRTVAGGGRRWQEKQKVAGEVYEKDAETQLRRPIQWSG